MYGIHVHEKVMEAYHLGEVTHSAATMHFVPDGEYDSGPACYSHEVEIFPTFTPEILAHEVNKIEHEDQWRITDKIVQGEISWDGKDPNSLQGGVFITE
jgi:folate-dependent phosphoribosylglycinamide formyltransferase PurN